jgi:hypothetical protein
VSGLAWHSPADLLGDLALAISVGKFVRAGESAHPHYHVIAMTEDRAWIRDIQHGTDHVIPFDRSRAIKDGYE